MVRAEVVVRCGTVEVASWPLRVAGRLDVGVVDDLARLQLEARRRGWSIWLRQACPDLVALLRFAGLADVLLQVAGQAEELEQVGVEEIVVPDDPIA